MEYCEFNPLRKQSQETEDEEPPRQLRTYPRRKLWKVAARHHMGKNKVGVNHCLERIFMKVRDEVRRLYAERYEYFYDRDWREDTSENSCVMHTLACSTLYLTLECDHDYNYKVYYHLEDCPFKDQILTLLQRLGTLKELESDMPAYFQYLRSYYKDNPLYFSHLKPGNQQS